MGRAPASSTVIPKRGQRLAFTMIELLVVITIITLLIGVLLPALRRARAQARQTVCLTRLRGVATASRVYAADDPAGISIPVHPEQFLQDPLEPRHVGAYEWGGKSGVGEPGYAPFEGALGSRYGTLAGFGPSSRPLNAVLYPKGFEDHRSVASRSRSGALRDTNLALDAFACPSDSGPPRGAHCEDWIAHPQRSSYDHFGTSYAANIFMIGASGGGYIESNSPYLRPSTRVPAPARTICYEENIGRWAWAARSDPCSFLEGIDPGPTRSVLGWHDRKWTFNLAFVDTHAAPHRIVIEGSEDEQGYARHYLSENLASYPRWDADSDGIAESEGSYELYRCVIVRGTGWAKDTLPAPPIQTGLLHDGDGRPSSEDCVGE